MAEPSWVCAAYGPEGREIGALCFFAQLWVTDCPDQATCQGRLAEQRVLVFERLKRLAEQIDPVLGLLALELHSPDELLGGPESRE